MTPPGSSEETQFDTDTPRRSMVYFLLLLLAVVLVFGGSFLWQSADESPQPVPVIPQSEPKEELTEAEKAIQTQLELLGIETDQTPSGSSGVTEQMDVLISTEGEDESTSPAEPRVSDQLDRLGTDAAPEGED